MADKQDSPDVLDDIKKIDKAIRAKTLATVLATLKEKAHQVLVLKEETVALLEAAGISDEDSKRVIDFVNSLNDVQLSDAEKNKLKDWAKEDVSEVKKKAEKKVNESPAIINGYVSVPAYSVAADSTLSTTTGTTTGTTTWRNGSGNLAKNVVDIRYSSDLATISSGASSFNMKL